MLDTSLGRMCKEAGPNLVQCNFQVQFSPAISLTRVYLLINSFCVVGQI